LALHVYEQVNAIWLWQVSAVAASVPLNPMAVNYGI